MWMGCASVYMLVTADKYELPILITESLAEMSRLTGFKKTKISEFIARKSERLRYINAKFIKIEIE